MISIIKKIFKKNPPKLAIPIISGILHIQKILSKSDDITNNYPIIINYLSTESFGHYTMPIFEHYHNDFYNFIISMVPYIVIDKDCILLLLIVKKILGNRDDVFMDAITKENKNIDFIINNHQNLEKLLLNTPSSSIYYTYLFRKIKKIEINQNIDRYIDALVSLRDKNQLSDFIITATYLNHSKSECSIDEFDNNLNIYKKQKSLINKLIDF